MMKALKLKLSSEINLSRLERIAIFRDLPETDLRKLDEWLRGKTFAAGTRLMTADQPGEAVYFILDGAVKVHVEQENGDEVIISILGPGEVFGEMSALDHQARSASVVTLEETTLLWMDSPVFRRFLTTIPGLSRNLSCILASRLRLANQQIQSLVTMEVENRIARQLLVFAAAYGQLQPGGDVSIPIRLTQSDIASLVGASREHTNKILVSYKERGYITVGRNHHITICNWGALARRCGQSWTSSAPRER